MTLDEFLDFLRDADYMSRRRKDKALTDYIKDPVCSKKIKRFRKINGIDHLPDLIEVEWLDGLQHGEHKHAELIYATYAQLSSYIHTNLRDFRPGSSINPYVTFEPEGFQKIYNLSLQTSDIIIYLLMLGIWTDICYYSPEMGEKFFVNTVREITEGLEEHQDSRDFLAVLPSLRSLVLPPRVNYSKKIEEEQTRRIMKRRVEKLGFIQCLKCPKKDECQKFNWMKERFGSENWFKEKLRL